MKSTFTFLFFSVAAFSFLPEKLCAQQASAQTQASSLMQMDTEQQRAIVHNWMNQSVSVVIPASFEKAAHEFYVKTKGDENAYRKYTVAFRPIFNPALSLADRIGFCQYLTANFSENEMPVSLIREQEILLKSQTEK